MASAAYRAGETLQDCCDFFTKKSKIHNYSNRSGVVTSAIVVPDHAPAEFRNRARLWNIAERGENRKDSRVAREIQLALPHELTDEQRKKAVQKFVQNHIVDAYGVGADYAIHAPDRQGDQRNHHAHIMLTTRQITSNGFHPKIMQELNDWTDGGAEVEKIRKAWEVLANKALGDAQIDSRLDCRSLKAQGIQRVPEPKQGAVATQIERGGRSSHAGEERRAVKLYNDALEVVEDSERGECVEDATEAIRQARRDNKSFTPWLCKRVLSFFGISALSNKKAQALKSRWQKRRVRELFRRHWTNSHCQSNQNHAQAPPYIQELEF